MAEQVNADRFSFCLALERDKFQRTRLPDDTASKLLFCKLRQVYFCHELEPIQVFLYETLNDIYYKNQEDYGNFYKFQFYLPWKKEP